MRPLGLVRPPGLAERLDEGKLRGLQFRVELDRALQAGNRFVGAALLQQAPAQLLVALGIPRFRGEREPEQGLRLLAATLAIERGAEERGEVRLAGFLGERVAAELLRHDARRRRAGT